MAEAVIVSTARTPIGRAFKGSLASVRPDDLAASILRTALDKVPSLPGSEVDDVIACAASAYGEQGYNLGRVVGQLAGLPESVPGTTVNRFCASSLQGLRMAFHAIRTGESQATAVVGVESVSRTAGLGFDEEHKNPRFVDESSPAYINDMYIPMGLTAENVAATYGITRERMDEFAVRSHTLALAARADGYFDNEITPVTLADGSVLSHDEGPRPGTNLEALSQLRPAFREDGLVTAGNSCPLSDGAAAIVVMSEDRAKELGLKPLARILASSVAGVRPEEMGIGPVPAVGILLKQTGLTIDDFDLVELNEAFAAQVLASADQLSIPMDRLNTHGGAIAVGHPFGMTGARLTTTLINGLQHSDGELGLVTLCIGGGQGMAFAVQRLS